METFDDFIKPIVMKWVNGFNHIPHTVLEKLIKYEGYESITELTYPKEGDTYYDILPCNGCWSFGWNSDEEFALEHADLMQECGLRVYEQDDYGLFFGIDGGNYSFYEAHWLPLFKKFFPEQIKFYHGEYTEKMKNQK